MPATKGDLLAFKDDISKATKGDILALRGDLLALRNVVVLKSDIKDMVVKSDIKDMVVKSDLDALKKDILKETKANTKEIVDTAIAELTIIISNSFTSLESKTDKKLEGKIEGVNSRIEGVHRRFDAHDLECVKRDEHDRLENRVRVLETA
jgi:hypothetical protein